MPKVIGTINLELLTELNEGTKHVALEGSTRSGKTVAIFQFLILEAIENPGIVIRVFRFDGATHGDTTIPTFEFCMGHEMFNLWQDECMNKTDKIYKFSNGSKICFDSSSKTSKLHGKESDIAFFNEVTEITWDAYKQIANRCRDLKIYDWNPSVNQHWIFDKILSRARKPHGPGQSFQCEESGVAYQHSTFIDNPCLSDIQVSEIESSDPSDPENVRNGTANQWFWDVYGLGKRGRVEGQVFTTYQVTEFWPDRHICQKHGYGLDFGFSQDPMALAEYRFYNNKIYAKELVYETGLLVTKNISKPNVPSLEHRFEELGIDKNAEIIADCARPDSIKDLQVAGYNVIPCTKGKDSIMAGINLVKSFMIMVHIDSNNLLMELEQYKWKRMQSGVWLQEPEDKNNHLLDGFRYYAMRNLSSPKKIMSQKPGRQIKIKSRARDRRR